MPKKYKYKIGDWVEFKKHIKVNSSWRINMDNKYSVQVDCQIENCRYHSDNNSCTKGEITICSRNVTIDYPVVVCKTYEKKGK